MRAHDVMTPDVTTVSPEATVMEVAKLLLDRGISAAPVVDAATGTLIGMVSEGDLLRRREIGTDKRRHGWRALLVDPETVAREYVKSRGQAVRDIMSSPVIVTSPEATVAEMAEIMEKQRIKRLPVVVRGRLVGLVTRADLVRALVQQAPQEPTVAVNDGSIRNTMLQRLGNQRFAAAGLIDVAVKDRVVTLSGSVSSDEQRDAVRVMAESIPGVAAVANEISVHPRLPLGL